MGRIELWIFLNAVTIVATLLLSLQNWFKLQQATRKLGFPGPEELRLLRARNYYRARADFYLGAFVLCLGAAMVVWAFSWGTAPVPGGILWGTGAFTVGWSLWSVDAARDWRLVRHITELLEGRTQ